jgi:UDP-N-acetyl-2-amino-2-deoxyglucuronate dehydrogenase
MPHDVGFAVIGLGMGTQHCRSIESAVGAYLVAVCDEDEARLQPIAEEYDCRPYENLDDLLEDDEVQVVCIATPSGTHAEIGIKVAAAGKHVVVEKPADISTEKIDSLTAAGRLHGVKIASIFQARFHPLNIRIRDAVVEGRLGALIGVHGHLPWYREQSYYEGPHGTWKGTWSMDGGGSLMNQGIHTVDLLQWFAGRVEGVMGMYGKFGHDIESEDQTVALLRFAGGAIGTLYTTTCCYPGFDQRITLYGSEGSIIKEEGTLISWKLAGDEGGREENEMMQLFGRSTGGTGTVDPLAVSLNGHTAIIADMAAAVDDDREPRIGLENARHSVEIINAVYAAARCGREVTVGDR